MLDPKTLLFLTQHSLLDRPEALTQLIYDCAYLQVSSLRDVCLAILALEYVLKDPETSNNHGLKGFANLQKKLGVETEYTQELQNHYASEYQQLIHQ